MLAALLIFAGCNAHIASFDVAPRHICAGQDVTIAWDVQGSAQVNVEPKIAGAPDGAVDSQGQATIKPAAAKTRVSLRVTRWLGKPDGADYDVEVTSPVPVEIAGSLVGSSCADGVLTVTADTKGFGDDVRAGRVSVNKRALDIHHQGSDGHEVAASVAPGASSDAFAGLGINGRWILSTKLGPDESCSKPPHVLTALIVPSCQGGAP